MKEKIAYLNYYYFNFMWLSTQLKCDHNQLNEHVLFQEHWTEYTPQKNVTKSVVVTRIKAEWISTKMLP